MHLIKSKSSTKIQSSPHLNHKNTSQTHLIPKKSSAKFPLRPQTQRTNISKNSKSKQNPKSSGLIARALSSAKSTIQKLINASKLQNDKKLHLIGSKFVYHEDDLIGKGYSSNVYKGSSIENLQNKNFAIKILDLSKIKGFLLDLLRKEISIHKNLDHPNIVKCIDVIETETHIYLIQEYCSGGDLSHFIAQRKSKIPEGQALNIMSQISEGYKYLIKQKVLHRDLKPCNIFRCKMNQKWKIGDFGFSCWSYQQSDDVNVGTPIYMPPQSLQKSKYSHKSDIFSLGVIMFEIIYGKVPWFSKSESLLVKKMQQNKINFEAEKISINNPLIKRFIERCCQVDFDLRMSEEEFLKLELYPRRPEQIKPLKNNFLSKTNTISKQEVHVSEQSAKNGNEEKKQKKIKQKGLIEINKQPIKMMTQSDSKKALTERINNESCKTSQYSTEAQTRAIKDEVRVPKDYLNSNTSSQEIYKKNGEILLKQNYLCKHLYFMIKNIEHFLLNDSNKQLLTIVMYKHILYILKKLKNTKFNYFQLKKWEAYKLSKQYSLFHKEVTVNFQRVESEYFRHPKRKDIKLFRQVDVRFKQFDHQVEFNMKFYLKFIEWQKSLIQEFVENLSNPHKADKTLLNDKKDNEKTNNNEHKQKELGQTQKTSKQTKDEKTPNQNNEFQQKQASDTVKSIQQKQQPKLCAQSILNPDPSKIISTIEIDALKLNDNQFQESILSSSISHATLQSLLSLIQYFQFMNSKISNTQEAHTSYSLIDLRHNEDDQNAFSLIRQYRNVQFTKEDIKKITNFTLFF